MFDAHSYSKGALILHYLRNEMGDEAFFKAISLYLNQNAFKTAEVHNLRLAFEEVTGQDYTPFFNQWYLGSGHPTVILEVLPKENQLVVDQSKTSLFLTQLPVRFYSGDSYYDSTFILRHYRDTFAIPSVSGYDLLQPNPEYTIPGIFQIDRTSQDYVNQYWKGRHIRDKVEVLTYLSEQDSLTEEWLDLLISASKHKHYNIRKRAIQVMALPTNSAVRQQVRRAVKLAVQDKHAHVRRAAVLVSSSVFEGEELSAIYFAALEDDSYGVMSAALSGLGKRFPERALPKARNYTSHEVSQLRLAGYEILATYGSRDDIRYFQKLKTNQLVFPNWKLLGHYISFVERYPSAANLKSLVNTFSAVEDSYSAYRTFFQRMVILPMLGLSQDLESKEELTTDEEKALEIIDQYITSYRERNE
jgi:aminopeptidase N